MSEPGEMPIKVGRRERAALARATGLTKGEAYVEGGYKGNLRTQPDKLFGLQIMRDRVQYLQGRAADRVIESIAVSRSEVIEGLRANWKAAKTGVEMMSKDGKGSGVFKPDFAAVNKALEAIGRTIGIFVDVSREENFQDLLDGMSAEDGQAFLAAMAHEIDPNLAKRIKAEAAPVVEIEVEGRVLN